MTTPPRAAHEASTDALVLRSPDALITAVPYLLGFHPRESLVLVWISRGRIVLTQRLDLPTAMPAPQRWLQAVTGHPAAHRGNEVVIVLATPDDDVAALAEQVMTVVSRAGVTIRDCLRMHGGRWWSVMCSDPVCCPYEGRLVDAQAGTKVASEFALLGVAPLPDRVDVEREWRTDAEAVDAVVAVLAETSSTTRPRGEALEQWRDAAITSVMRVLSEPAVERPDPRDDATLILGLRDVRVRDTVLWECAQLEAEVLQRASIRLSTCVRSSPPSFVAPVATIAAVVAWLLGDGARAGIAVDRALADDPEYSLAGLVWESLRRGFPPEHWRAAMSDLTREDCRRGNESRLAG